MSGASTDFPVAILAGGLATRLRQVTDDDVARSVDGTMRRLARLAHERLRNSRTDARLAWHHRLTSVSISGDSAACQSSSSTITTASAASP